MLKKHLFYFWSNSQSPVDYIPIVVKMGQSNSLGFSERTRLLALTSYTDKPDKVKRFIQLGFGTAGGGWMDYFSGLQVGSGCVIGKKLVDNLGHDVYIIEAGRGSTSLASKAGNNNDWNELNTTDCFENATVRMFTEGIAKIPNPNSLPLKVVYIEWHQGENDQGVGADYAAYATNLASMFTALRAYHALLAEAPIILYKINWAAGAGQTAVNNALQAYADNVSNNAYIIDPYATSAYPWKQNLPAGTLSTYPPIASSDDNHASYVTQVNKGELTYQKLLDIGRIGGTKAVTTYTNDNHVQAVLYYCTANGITHPTANNITALNTLLTTLKASTVFKKLIYLSLKANDSSKAFGSFNFLAPTSGTNDIYDGTSWVTKQGGATNYFYMFTMTQLFGAGSHPNPYWQNDISMGVLVHDFTSTVHFGIRKTGDANDFYFTGNTAGSTARAFGSTTATPTITTSNKFFAISRQFGSYPDSSTSWDYYVDGTKTTVTDTRTGTTTDNLQFKRDGSATDNSRNSAAFIGYGITESEMTVLRNALTTYKASL